ncbi:hypothetical protein MNV49_000343 [Pseudohyphozyma bogoriensis]|nr:hypothetical protein MNV49_000343 [Pseudohyphozyma bogoriensis]
MPAFRSLALATAIFGVASVLASPAPVQFTKRADNDTSYSDTDNNVPSACKVSCNSYDEIFTNCGESYATGGVEGVESCQCSTSTAEAVLDCYSCIQGTGNSTLITQYTKTLASYNSECVSLYNSSWTNTTFSYAGGLNVNDTQFAVNDTSYSDTDSSVPDACKISCNAYDEVFTNCGESYATGGLAAVTSCQCSTSTASTALACYSCIEGTGNATTIAQVTKTLEAYNDECYEAYNTSWTNVTFSNVGGYNVNSSSSASAAVAAATTASGTATGSTAAAATTSSTSGAANLAVSGVGAMVVAGFAVLLF